MLDDELEASELNLHSSNEPIKVAWGGGGMFQELSKEQQTSSCPLEIYLHIISTWFVSF